MSDDGLRRHYVYWIDKAKGLPADEVFLDLEDAVAADAKAAARTAVATALAEPGWAGQLRGVRVNDWTTPWTHADLIEVVAGAGHSVHRDRPDAVLVNLLPEDIYTLDNRPDLLEAIIHVVTMSIEKAKREETAPGRPRKKTPPKQTAPVKKTPQAGTRRASTAPLPPQRRRTNR